MYKKICITNRRLVCDKLNISDYNGEEASMKLLLQIEKVCKTGVDIIILREKDMDESSYESLAKAAIDICKRYDVLLVLHTFVEVAKRLKHPHIHVPYANFCELVLAEDVRFGMDEACEDAKTFFFKTIGVSTHSMGEALVVARHKASYVTISPVYETTCKPGVKPKGLDFLEKIAHNTTIPVYALGGVNEERVKECILHGASGVCMMSEYMQL